MRTLARAVGSKDIGGEPLPHVFRTFDINKIVIRRAEVSMIAGTPGAGKSTLALAVALRSKVPTLYISADTNAHTMAMRILSMITGQSQSVAEQFLIDDVEKTRKIINEHAGHIFWSFESAPTLRDLDLECAAFEELWGCPPTLIVVDNLMDIAGDGGDEFGAMRSNIKELKYLARDTNAAVLILHHTKESYVGNPCQPRSALQGMVAQLPALILTVGSNAPGFIAVAPVKNRYGKADQSGDTNFWLKFNPEFMEIADIPESATSAWNRTDNTNTQLGNSVQS
jgi:energy-coupling factor transporter ATP-binding protein EcfA2